MRIYDLGTRVSNLLFGKGLNKPNRTILVTKDRKGTNVHGVVDVDCISCTFRKTTDLSTGDIEAVSMTVASSPGHSVPKFVLFPEVSIDRSKHMEGALNVLLKLEVPDRLVWLWNDIQLALTVHDLGYGLTGNDPANIKGGLWAAEQFNPIVGYLVLTCGMLDEELIEPLSKSMKLRAYEYIRKYNSLAGLPELVDLSTAKRYMDYCNLHSSSTGICTKSEYVIEELRRLLGDNNQIYLKSLACCEQLKSFMDTHPDYLK